ncbi:MAG: SCO family protein, partial [Rickettsiaceae bacterium]|nr:SCO family protein [Rickettsiaceae bacterium]
MPKKRENKEANVFAKVVIIVSMVIALVSLYFFMAYKTPNKPLNGAEIEEEVKIGGDFTLIDQHGNSFSSDKLKGKPSIIYFGFTFCPDICPTALEKITTVVDELDKYYT